MKELIQKTNKQIQIELKVKNVSKIRSRIYYTCTYIFNNSQQQQQQQQENHDTAFNKKCTISIHYESLHHSMYGEEKN